MHTVAQYPVKRIQKAKFGTARRLVLGVICVILLATATNSAFACITYGMDSSVVLADPNVVIRGSTAADGANVMALLDGLRFDDGSPAYYLVYPNAASCAADSLAAGDTTAVTYQGNSYTATVFVGDHFDGAGGLSSIINNNTTIFFQPGNYVTTAGKGDYAYLYKKNLSLIGLQLTSGAPTVTFDLGYMVVSGWTGGNQNPRNLIDDNFYAANIIFEGGGRDMKAKQSRSDQAYYLHITGDNVAFDNVTVRNIGTGSSLAGDHNTAINCINAQTAVFHDCGTVVLPESGFVITASRITTVSCSA